MSKNFKNSEGFSLIDMAMVVIIVALIASTVTTGGHLIQSAKLRSIISDIEGYESAFVGFELNYNAKPGDMPNATEFWATECVDDEVNESNNCNGNGDGIVASALTEGLRAWQHMGLAGTLPDKYTGTLSQTVSVEISQNDENLFDMLVGSAYAKQLKVDICHMGATINIANPGFLNGHLNHGDTIGACEGSGGEAEEAVEVTEEGEPEIHLGKFSVGVNVPATSIAGAGFKIDWNDGQLLTFAKERSPLLDGSALTPLSAWSIDNKIDDGIASAGKVISADGDGEVLGCVTEEDGYDLLGDTVKCQVHIWLSE